MVNVDLDSNPATKGEDEMTVRVVKTDEVLVSVYLLFS